MDIIQNKKYFNQTMNGLTIDFVDPNGKQLLFTTQAVCHMTFAIFHYKHRFLEEQAKDISRLKFLYVLKNFPKEEEEEEEEKEQYVNKYITVPSLV